MKLGGFALKKGRKKALSAREQPQAFAAATPAAPQAPAKVFVTDFDPSAPAALAADGQPPLVIPLIQTNEWQPDAEQHAKKGGQIEQQPAESEKAEPQTADERAAKLLLAEATRSTDQSAEATAVSSTLVIPMSGRMEESKTDDAPASNVDEAKAAKRAALFQDVAQRHHQDEAARDGKHQKKPILQQNAVPGLDALADVTDKYRHDVALRPDAPDVHSDVYNSVPVEAFGAALLRGMGWKGSVDADDEGEAPKPRHKLLGLGATKRPPMAGDDKRKKRSKKRRTEDKRGEEKEAPAQRSATSDRRDERDASSRSSNREKDDRRRDKRRGCERPASRDEGRDHRRPRSRSQSRDSSRRRDQDRDRGRDGDRKRDRHGDDRRKSRRSRSRSRELDRRSSRR